MLTMVHANGVRQVDGTFAVDRKFHLGMQMYASSIEIPIVSVNLLAAPTAVIMDKINVSPQDMGYRLIALPRDKHGNLLPEGRARLEAELKQSRLMYGGNYAEAALARKIGLPYIVVLEKDLRTEIDIATVGVSNPVRRLVRCARQINAFRRRIPCLKQAWGVHCNGYPVYEESRRFNRNCLLYLDSRMSEDQVIPEAILRTRLQQRSSRPIRLLFSGRFEPIKAPVDAVQVAVECLRGGLNIEMHCYGQGSLRDEMRTLIDRHGYGDRIFVHGTVPYPELMKIAQGFDIFVCCHIQSDPSCTYLEALGCGLPIVGYGNRMWKGLHQQTGVGYWSKIGDPGQVAADIAALIADPEGLDRMSVKARDFAGNHTFEKEYAKRINDIKLAMVVTN